MTLFAVMGSPIAHSQSPFIHETFGRLLGLPVRYERRLVPSGDLPAALARFREEGGVGVNITVPLKSEAFALADRVAPRAQAARAVNTMHWDGSLLLGDNTDGAGLVSDLMINQGVALRGRRVFLAGAGGAAQGIIAPLLAEGIESLVLFNRTRARAAALVALVADSRVSVAALARDLQPFDIVINATAAGLAGCLPHFPSGIFKGAVAYDLVYGPRAQGFLSYAKAQGARLAIDGLGMLVEQAAESFQIWHGVYPPTAPVLQMLRSGSA